MVDQQTLEVYEKRAEVIFANHVTAAREHLRVWLLRHLQPGEPTADIGCGSGVDLEWLISEGFPAIGYEPVSGLRGLCLEKFPRLDVRISALPDLPEIEDGVFSNVVCSAVLMHLPIESVPTAVANLARILRTGGRLLFTFRSSNNQLDWEEDGRLFTPIAPNLLDRSLSAAGLHLIEQGVSDDRLRPGVVWTSVAAKRLAP